MSKFQGVPYFLNTQKMLIYLALVRYSDLMPYTHHCKNCYKHLMTLMVLLVYKIRTKEIFTDTHDVILDTQKIINDTQSVITDTQGHTEDTH